jgi:hypothetical protein
MWGCGREASSQKLLRGVDGVQRGCFWRVLGGVHKLNQITKIVEPCKMDC